MGNPKNWTGERLEPFIFTGAMLEHLHRYAIALEFVKGKKVLDIACGEGYGVNLMAKSALQVTGIDIDNLTIEKAITKYKQENISFKHGSILQIPAQDGSFDLITCFETLEHVNDHNILMSELKRVLKPSGLLIISTPEKLNYSDNHFHKNLFHQKELYGEEFKSLLESFFSYNLFYKQICLPTSVIHNEKINKLEKVYTGDYNNIKEDSSITTMYWLAFSSDIEIPKISSSIFQHQKTISQMLYEEAEAVKRTVTYRTGNFLLSPFKFIRSIFRK